jgi:hypothetical protein
MNHKKIQARASKKCRVCKEPFTQYRSTQIVCSINCSKTYAETLRVKRERVELKEARQRIKTKAEWAREAQNAFNQYIRARDEGAACISCGRDHQGQYHAGHYRSVGANPELRFEEHNVHKQCAPCNNHLSGNIVNYRIGLISKIGIDRVEWLEGPHEPKKYTIEDLIIIKSKYAKLTKELINQRG